MKRQWHVRGEVGGRWRGKERRKRETREEGEREKVKGAVRGKK